MRKIGIDVGTCNIKGAEKKKNGDVSYVKLGKQIDKPRIPNVILYEQKEDDIAIYIGETALKKPASEQDKVRNIKSFLQESNWSRELSFGKVVSAYDVTLDIMKSLYDEMHNSNKNEDISATITVPVNFSKRQQMIVEMAAQNAGFIVESVITEPFASIFYLMQESFEEDDNHNVLIFDFGGGTLDLCLADIKHKDDKVRIETQATVGISYGGNNINDDIIENLVMKKAGEKLHKALDEQENVLRRAVNRYYIMEALDTMKAELFEDEDVNEDETSDLIARLFDGSVVEFGSYSVSDIYNMFTEKGWKKRIFSLLDSLFDNSSSLIPDEVSDIFIIGGTSSIPYFRNCLIEYFRNNGQEDVDSLFKLNDDMDSDDRIYSSVSKGAAIYNELMDDEDIEIKDRIPFLVYSKDEKNKECTKISLDVCYKDYASALAPLTKVMKKNRKIEIYQKIYGEDDKEVYLGDIQIDDEIVNNATLYRLTVDKHRNIKAEFGYLLDEENEDLEEAVCIDWCLNLVITV